MMKLEPGLTWQVSPVTSGSSSCFSVLGFLPTPAYGTSFGHFPFSRLTVSKILLQAQGRLVTAAFADSGWQQPPDQMPHFTLRLHFPHLYQSGSHGKCSGFLSFSGKTEENRNKEDSIFVTKLQFLEKVPGGVRASLDSGRGGGGNMAVPSLGAPKIPMLPAEGHPGPGDQHGGLGPYLRL